MRPLPLPRARTAPAAVLLLALLTPAAPEADLAVGAAVRSALAARPCHPHPAPAAVPQPVAAAGVVTVVALVVAPSSRLRLAADGSAVAAATNTGRAPCATDVWTVEPAGRPAPQDLVDAVLNRLASSGRDADDWEPGAWTPLD